MNLEWTHFPAGQRPELSPDDTASLGIAYYFPDNDGQLAFAGEHYRLYTEALRYLTFCVRVTVPGTTQHLDRIFRLIRSEAALLGWRVVGSRGEQ